MSNKFSELLDQLSDTVCEPGKGSDQLVVRLGQYHHPTWGTGVEKAPMHKSSGWSWWGHSAQKKCLHWEADRSNGGLHVKPWTSTSWRERSTKRSCHWGHAQIYFRMFISKHLCSKLLKWRNLYTLFQPKCSQSSYRENQIIEWIFVPKGLTD